MKSTLKNVQRVIKKVLQILANMNDAARLSLSTGKAVSN